MTQRQGNSKHVTANHIQAKRSLGCSGPEAVLVNLKLIMFKPSFTGRGCKKKYF